MIDERPSETDEQRLADVDRHGGIDRLGGRVARLAAAAMILLFWLVWHAIITVYTIVNNPSEYRTYIGARTIIALIGVLISFVTADILFRARGKSLARRALIALAITVVGTFLYSLVALRIWDVLHPADMGESSLQVMFAGDFITRLWYAATVTAMILALSYVLDIQERERRIVALQGLAHSAQLRALRSQLNPHFLFNALNSIAALLSRDRNGEAERMTENLADFLRTTLALDPQQLITLGDELRLQELYLSVEKVRFPTRLNVAIELPAELDQALVPSLILQPLVENSIKYAVARSTEMVNLHIGAEAGGDMLTLVVEDDGGNAVNETSNGVRFGVANVHERLNAHYGDRASFQAGPTTEGGFRNLIRLPLATA